MAASRLAYPALCCLLAAAALQQTLAAVGVVDVGDASGAEPAGSVIAKVAFLALLVATPLVLVAAAVPRAVELRAAWLVPLAGAWLAVAHLLSPDAYYAPHVHRFADSVSDPWRWLLATVLVGVGAAFVLARHRRIGLLVCAAALAWDVLALLAGAFH
jgi:hypothetical protein